MIHNVSQDEFVDGEYSNERMDYHVLGIGGTATFLNFPGCDRSTAIKLRLSQILTDDNIQIWGVSSMKHNLSRELN